MDFDYLMLMSQLKFRDVIPWATPNIAKTYDHENLWLPKLKIMMIDHIVNVTQKNPKAKTHIWKLDNHSSIQVEQNNVIDLVATWVLDLEVFNFKGSTVSTTQTQR